MKNKFIVLIITSLCLLGWHKSFSQNIDIQGHRGAKGVMPENTIPSFISALDSGATTLEMDVVISADGKVIVSHEPWFRSDICLDSSGNKIPKSDQRRHNIYKMSYEEIKKYDCGSLQLKQFPNQQKMKISKPLLSDVFRAVEKHIKSYTQYEVDYNIELKSTPNGDESFHPPPIEFSDIVYDLTDQYIPLERVIIQSFDFRVLRYWDQKYPEIRIAALVDHTRSVNKALEELGFQPDIYSPDHRLLNKRRVKQLQKMGINVVPWTVNDKKRMEKFIEWSVDGIITDYPGRLRNLLEEKIENE